MLIFNDFTDFQLCLSSSQTPTDKYNQALVGCRKGGQFTNPRFFVVTGMVELKKSRMKV